MSPETHTVKVIMFLTNEGKQTQFSSVGNLSFLICSLKLHCSALWWTNNMSAENSIDGSSWCMLGLTAPVLRTLPSVPHPCGSNCVFNGQQITEAY